MALREGFEPSAKRLTVSWASSAEYSRPSDDLVWCKTLWVHIISLAITTAMTAILGLILESR